MTRHRMAKSAAGLSIFALSAMILTGFATPAPAQDTNDREYPSAVSTFERICLVPGVEPSARLSALTSDSSWQEDKTVTVDIAQMSISRAIERNYSFNNISNARQWSGKIDGQNARFVVASFNGKSRYPNLCALVLEGPRNALPYSDALKAAFKSFGIGGKSVDLVHYFEFAGKVGTDKHPVRGEIFSRSLSGSAKQTTHIYVAY